MNEPDVLTTVEWYRSAEHLYTTAIHAMKAYYAWTSEPEDDWKDLKEMHRQFKLLHKALTRFNYGVDPLKEGGAK